MISIRCASSTQYHIRNKRALNLFLSTIGNHGKNGMMKYSSRSTGSVLREKGFSFPVCVSSDSKVLLRNKSSNRSFISNKNAFQRRGNHTNANDGEIVNLGGQLFFGSLCALTFFLGCWQTQRYFQKQDSIKERTAQLEGEPLTQLLPTSFFPSPTYQRIQLRGKFYHDHEILVGPRALPEGYLPDTKKSSNNASGGQMPNAKGYYVVTPFHVEKQKNDKNTEHNEEDDCPSVIMVNRGWVPMDFVHDSSNNRINKIFWERPQGEVDVTVLPSKPEEPKYVNTKDGKETLAIEFYMNENAFSRVLKDIQHHLKGKGRSDDNNDDIVLLCTQLSTDDGNAIKFPLKPSKDIVGDFVITPIIHVGYAVTWYGLSIAGVFMTRKLLTRGRG